MRRQASHGDGVTLRRASFPVLAAGIVRGRDAAVEAYRDVFTAFPAASTGNDAHGRAMRERCPAPRRAYARFSIST
jgi:hypothetical protein